MSLNKMKSSADEYYLKGDEEYAYILYMKFFNLLSTINNKPEFMAHKHEIASKCLWMQKETNTEL